MFVPIVYTQGQSVLVVIFIIFLRTQYRCLNNTYLGIPVEMYTSNFSIKYVVQSDIFTLKKMWIRYTNWV